MDSKVRMADIAAKLDVSIVTVSKALSGKDGVSDELREKIITLAEEMGYVPLRTNLAKKRMLNTGNIGILTAQRFFEDNSFYASLYRQVLVACDNQGYSAMMELVSPKAEQNCTLPAMIQGKKVDGIIFMGEISRAYLRTVSGVGLPYMLLDFYDEDQDTGSVTSDNLTGGYRLANHLIETGRMNIGFIGSINATSSIMDRFLGVRKAQLRAGLPFNADWLLEDRDADGNLIPIRLPDPMPQAFICSYDNIARNLIEQLKQEGYQVPEDVAVTGYDDTQVAKFSSPQLTTYRVNTEDMGKMVVAQLVQRIKEKHYTHGNIIISGEMICRGST